MIERRRGRASRFLARRELAVQRMSQQSQGRHELIAQQLQHGLETAAARRLALQELNLERLKQDHRLVMDRLAMSREEDGPLRDEQRRQIEQRLEQAERARAERIAARAAQAGRRAARAREAGALSQALRLSAAEAKRQRLEERLRLAEERRQAALASPSRSPRGDRRTHGPLFPYEPAAPQAEPPAADDIRLRVDNFRRQVCCRKLQQCWRAFAGKHRTTRALVAAVVSSGIVDVQLPQQSGDAGSASVTEKQQHQKQQQREEEETQPAVSTPTIAIIGLGRGGNAGKGGGNPALDDFEIFAASMRSPSNVKAAQASGWGRGWGGSESETALLCLPIRDKIVTSCRRTDAPSSPGEQAAAPRSARAELRQTAAPALPLEPRQPRPRQTRGRTLSR